MLLRLFQQLANTRLNMLGADLIERNVELNRKKGVVGHGQRDLD